MASRHVTLAFRHDQGELHVSSVSALAPCVSAAVTRPIRKTCGRSLSSSTGLRNRCQLIYGVDVKRLESSDLHKDREVFAGSGLPVPAIPGDETFPLSDFPDPTSSEYAFFVQDSIDIGRWILLLGSRYDHYEIKPEVMQHYLNSQPINSS